MRTRFDCGSRSQQPWEGLSKVDTIWQCSTRHWSTSPGRDLTTSTTLVQCLPPPSSSELSSGPAARDGSLRGWVRDPRSSSIARCFSWGPSCRLSLGGAIGTMGWSLGGQSLALVGQNRGRHMGGEADPHGSFMTSHDRSACMTLGDILEDSFAPGQSVGGSEQFPA